MPLMHRLPQLLAALTLAWALPPGVAQTIGTVIAMGGAMSADNQAVWQRVVQAAGGPGARFVVLATASDDPAGTGAGLVAQLQRFGAVAQALPVAPRLEGIDLQAAVRDPRWIAQVQAARGVFFSGGDQNRIVDTLSPGGVDTPLMAAVRDVLVRGGVIAGTSAGAAIASERMFLGGDPLAVLRDTAGPVIGPGLGLIRPGVLVDQHFLKRGRVGRLLPALWRSGIPLGIGVDEDSAIAVQGDRAEALGARGALVVDLRGASSNPAQAAFNLRGARFSYLDRGDRLDLASGRITPSAAKQAGRAVGEGQPGWRPYHGADAFFADLLADFAIVSAMQHLVDGRGSEVRGLSFDPQARADQPQADLGFEWRLTRSPDTRAWSVGDAYSIDGVRVDVMPVRMARPLYTPLP